MLIWIPNYISSLSMDAQLMRSIFKMVKKGDLKPGDHLPTSRELSKQTSVPENVIIHAYNQLNKLQMVHLSDHVPRRAFISDTAKQQADEVSIYSTEFYLMVNSNDLCL